MVAGCFCLGLLVRRVWLFGLMAVGVGGVGGVGGVSETSCHWCVISSNANFTVQIELRWHEKKEGKN